MWKQSIKRAAIAGVLYVIFKWVGDKFLFDSVPAEWWWYAVEYVLFTVIIACVYRYLLPRDNKKKEGK